ncbi:MAG: PEGA domain-containing protein [Fibromonadaceae bacterium]|nr:PEGA domain-containing protein [Fibromonadaceae bacterium]
MNKVLFFLVLLLLSLVFAQEGAIRIKIPLDSTGMLIGSPKSETQPQKLGLSGNRPLNLAELSAKDTASYETYSRRLALVQDSIAAMQKEIETSKKRTAAQMPPLEPKDEYEKQSEFEYRKEKRERELGERMLRDYKPFADRLFELEKTKKKIEDNRSTLYCIVEINTNPVASIYINNEEIGTSPAKYDRVLPGNTVIKVQKENYEPWDTTITLQPMQKIKLSATLQEKSIFSKEGEIDFPKIIASDTTVKGYLARMNRVKARMKQIDEEIKIILADEHQKKDEATQNLLKHKHEAYTSQLVRTLNVLENNIIATESQLIAETSSNASITLGTYDVENEVFELEVQDTANTKSPFHFTGWVGIPRDTAKAMNRSTDGFLVGVNYLNYPFVSDASSFNLAMKELSLSRKAVPLQVEGDFKPSKFGLMEGYSKWRPHADSLLNGTLKANSCLDLDYVIGKKICDASGIATTELPPQSESASLGWRNWTRILTFSTAAVLGGFAVVKYFDQVKYVNRANEQRDEIAKNPGYPEDLYNTYSDKAKKSGDSKIIFGVGVGVFAVAGALTFVF